MTVLSILLVSTLRAATPLVLVAIGGLICERSGVVNIALDGIMLVGAFAAVYVSFLTHSAWLGVAAGVFAGVAISAIHAVVSIRFHANQVVSGTAINLLASGLTEFITIKVWGAAQSPSVPKVPDLFGINIFVYVAFLLAFLMQFLLWKTRWGLRLRSVGEHPLAADTVGINVAAVRYQGVLLSGVFAGLGGASLSLGLLSMFQAGITAGRGFIGLAAVIFGKWNPLGAVLACLLFGAADALSTIFQTLGVNVPTQFLSMAPYILTMLALAGLVGRSIPPAASGTPYEKSH